MEIGKTFCGRTDGRTDGRTHLSSNLLGHRRGDDLIRWQWHRPDHMQIICILLQTDNHATIKLYHRLSYLSTLELNVIYKPHHNHNRFTALFPEPPGWAGARKELLNFMVQGKINRSRYYTDNPAGRHSVQTNQCPPPPSPTFLQAGCPSCRPTNSVKANVIYKALHKSTGFSLYHFTTWCHASTVYATVMCLSVTSQCSTETNKRRIMQSTPYDSPGTLVIWRQRHRQNSDRVIPNGGAKCRRVG